MASSEEQLGTFQGFEIDQKQQRGRNTSKRGAEKLQVGNLPFAEQFYAAYIFK